MATAHAEIGVIQQAKEAGLTKGADMRMSVVGQEVCGYCRGDIPAAASAAGLNSLTIVDGKTGQFLYWAPGMRSLGPAK